MTVRLYLSIEKLRMGDRLSATEEVPEELLSCLVPRFCLQIPVENAIRHGVAPSSHPGHVRIVARRHSARHLFLSVSDNGVGGARSNLLPLSDIAPGDAPLHGLTLLALRLRLFGPPPRAPALEQSHRRRHSLRPSPPSWRSAMKQANTAEHNRLSTAHALVVDDEALPRAHLAHLLREMGVGIVEEAPNGPECLARCAQDEVDWVFLDIRMPVQMEWPSPTH